MAKVKTVNKVETATVTYLDKPSLCIVITTLLIILATVIVGVCVWFLLEETLSRIILISLICFLLVLGIVVLTALYFRKKAVSKNTVGIVRNGAYHNIQPSAPQADTSWEYTNRKTLPA